MYGLYYSGFVSLRTAAGALVLAAVLLLGAGNCFSGMLVAEGKYNHYVAEQEEGAVYVVNGDGEWVRVAGGLGLISGLCVCPDRSVYVFSASQRRLYRITPDGVLNVVCKAGSQPQAIFADRDGKVHFVQRKGVVTGVK